MLYLAIIGAKVVTADAIRLAEDRVCDFLPAFKVA